MTCAECHQPVIRTALRGVWNHPSQRAFCSPRCKNRFHVRLWRARRKHVASTSQARSLI